MTAYRATPESSTLDAEGRRAEADRILDLLQGNGLLNQSSRYVSNRFSDPEGRFIDELMVGGDVTVKQLFWLRDIKDKYL